MWIVKLGDGEKTAAKYGPLANEAEANRFAEFLTEEVDPAAVEYRPPYSFDDVLSPVVALLDWRDRFGRPQ